MAIKDPNVALLFVAVGLLLFYAECLRPGFVIFASLGGVLLLTGLYGFSTHPISLVPLLVLCLGAVLIVAEAARPMYGLAALAGFGLIHFGGANLCVGMRPLWTAPILTVLSGATLYLLRFASIAWSNKHVALSIVNKDAVLCFREGLR